MWSTYFAIAIGGIIGCCVRYGITGPIQAIFGKSFPVATLFINVLGSFLMGFLFIFTLERMSIPPALRAGILVGGLGGFTTFSTFSMEILQLVEAGEMLKAGMYIALSVILGVLAAFLGVYWARSLWQ